MCVNAIARSLLGYGDTRSNGVLDMVGAAVEEDIGEGQSTYNTFIRTFLGSKCIMHVGVCLTSLWNGSKHMRWSVVVVSSFAKVSFCGVEKSSSQDRM